MKIREVSFYCAHSYTSFAVLLLELSFVVIKLFSFRIFDNLAGEILIKHGLGLNSFDIKDWVEKEREKQKEVSFYLRLYVLPLDKKIPLIKHKMRKGCFFI